MIQQAMYIGKKVVDEKERTNSKTGEIIPAFKGTRYMFLVNEWYKNGTIADLLGRTYQDKREESEQIESIENGTIQPGKIVNVNIRNSDYNVNFFCRYDEENDSSDETPF